MFCQSTLHYHLNKSYTAHACSFVQSSTVVVRYVIGHVDRQNYQINSSFLCTQQYCHTLSAGNVNGLLASTKVLIRLKKTLETLWYGLKVGLDMSWHFVHLYATYLGGLIFHTKHTQIWSRWEWNQWNQAYWRCSTQYDQLDLMEVNKRQTENIVNKLHQYTWHAYRGIDTYGIKLNS